ncbi:MAG: methyltransferase domain-containing protein [Syntrophobacteraceae bacterium]
MTKLLPDQLKDLWQKVEQQELSREEFQDRQESLLAEHRGLWQEALILPGFEDLSASIIAELCRYTDVDDSEIVQRRCTEALSDLKGEWGSGVTCQDPGAIERFYDQSQAMIYELMWWHTLNDDNSPLSYVVALELGKAQGCRQFLDFGSGVGSGAILFAHHGFNVTLADISSTMLQLCRWRMEGHGLTGSYLDLKEESLPDGAFDIVCAMDVFEHLSDPVGTVEALWRAMKPGGFLYGRFHAEQDEDRPHHIVQDFQPTLKRLSELGFREFWRDEWLWGHQVFRKAEA